MKSAQKPGGKANTQKGNAFPSRCGFDLTQRFLLFRTRLREQPKIKVCTFLYQVV